MENRPGWRTVKVGEISQLFDGPHQTAPLDPKGDIVYLNVGDIQNGRIKLRNSGRVTEEVASRWNKRVVPEPGDLVFGYEATLGEAAVLPSGHRWCLGRRVGLLRPNREKVDPHFLAYSWYSPQWQETLRANRIGGSTIESIRLTDLPHWTIEVPSLAEQRGIAHILGALDDKIELNRRMGETLEAMARALFKSWFVDFDPVRAKAEGRETGLPREIVDLFPERLVESEIGEVPEGWSARPLYEAATYINGAAYAAFKPNDSHRGLPIIKIAELKSGVTEQTGFSEVVMTEKYQIGTGDILFAWSGNPDTSIDTFVWSRGPGWLNQHIFRVVPHAQGERAFLLGALRNLKPVFAEIARNKQTTGLGHVTVADMKRLPISWPDPGVLHAWDDVAGSLYARQLEGELENHSLACIRDRLLPKLISGEVRVGGLRRDWASA